MCNSKLIPLIKKFKSQDMSVFEAIYGEFAKLINFYASHIATEDANSELTLFLIELLYAVDLSRFKNDCNEGLKKYIAVCIRNEYISISKSKEKLERFTYELFENYAGYTENQEDKIAVEQVFKYLTEKQRKVLVYRYKYGYSDVEIANILNIKRQAVNQLKNRAFEII